MTLNVIRKDPRPTLQADNVEPGQVVIDAEGDVFLAGRTDVLDGSNLVFMLVANAPNSEDPWDLGLMFQPSELESPVRIVEADLTIHAGC